MGLDTTHDCWHGSYSAFGRFREALAQAAGIPLDLCCGFCEDRGSLGPDILTRSLPGLSYHDILKLCEKSPSFPISWEVFTTDPLIYLLDHSDCEGHILHKHTLALAIRLEELVLSEPYAEYAKQFATGLRQAHKSGERVRFH